jgi:hypothetical protein
LQGKPSNEYKRNNSLQGIVPNTSKWKKYGYGKVPNEYK